MTATGPLALEFVDHFIQRWNFVKKNKYDFDPKYPILPYRFGTQSTPMDTINILSNRLSDHLHIGHGKDKGHLGFNAQLVRSASKWSQGVDLEHSVQNAYIDLILHAHRIDFSRAGSL